MHDVLVDPKNQGTQNMVDKYYKECSLLSELRHPHIVQFLGICFFPDSRFPVLVMELLQTSLDSLLEEYPDIPVHVKLLILHDVTKGLVFLHTRNPVVVHRDLTARNVLLDAAMTAKIADLGNSRITDLRPGQLAQTMTKGIPGTLVYMPPEASTDHYGPPLDMFSFGHLSLFAAIQVFPHDLLGHTYPPRALWGIRARTELERRERYIITLEKKLGERHALVSLIKGCLANDPGKRPPASEALKRLSDMVASQKNYKFVIRFQLEKSLAEKSAEAELLARDISRYTERLKNLNLQLEEIKVKMAELEAEAEATVTEKGELQAMTDLQAGQMEDLKQELEKLRLENNGLKDVCQGKDDIIESKGRQVETTRQLLKASTQQLSDKTLALTEKSSELSLLQQRCNSLMAELDASQTKIHTLTKKEEASENMLLLKENEMEALSRQLEGKSKLLQAINMKMSPPELLPDIVDCKLPLKWRNSTDMPLGAVLAQAVAIGEKIYIGGGWMYRKKASAGGEECVVETNVASENKVRANNSVLEYSITEEGFQWREIVAPSVLFGMAAVDNQLITAGGFDPDNDDNGSDQVSVLDSNNKTWAQPFPTMPTARYWTSAIGYKRWLVVVGGMANDAKNIVEVLDTNSKLWYKASPLPSPTLRPSLALIDDTLYIAWGNGAEENSFACQTLIPTLILNAICHAQASAKNTKWQALPNTPTSFPVLVPLHGHLLAVGGFRTPSSILAIHLPHIQQWKKVAELPTPRSGFAGCSFPLATKEVMVIAGGQDENKFTMETCELYMESN